MISSTYLQFYRRRRQVPEAIRAVRHRDLHGNSHQGRFLLEAVQALHGFENCARRRRHHLHRSCRETVDPPVPMLKYTNLDVIRVLVDLKNHTILIYNKASEMGEEANKQVRVGWVSFNLPFIDGDGMNNGRNSQKVIWLSFNWLQKEKFKYMRGCGEQYN
ncbi:unnamed protein product [Brassica napus]|uniref:(rape) hypothetical protein n=1 Tax=Brassica napus TaxID=3708 RepID=A0A816X768_BRANA|nr:unnamed protein product [Brassica napus]